MTDPRKCFECGKGTLVFSREDRFMLDHTTVTQDLEVGHCPECGGSELAYPKMTSLLELQQQAQPGCITYVKFQKGQWVVTKVVPITS
jgi:ribosomal protein S27AE